MRWRAHGIVLGAGLLLSACLPEGQQLPQAPLLSALEPKSGRIAVLGPDRNVYTMDQAGGDLIPITDDASVEGSAVLYRTPTWSPGADRLALPRHLFEDGTLTHSSVIVVPSDGSSRSVVFETEDDHPVYLDWSPAGDRLTVLTTGRTRSGVSMWNVPVDGGEPQLIDAGQAAFWDWTPGGGELLAHIDGSAAENPGRARVSLLHLGSSVSERRLAVEPSDFQTPALSPDGALALIAGDGASGEPALLLTTPWGDNIAELIPLESEVAFGWSPAGRYAAYITAEPGQQNMLGRLRLLDLEDPGAPVAIETGDSLAVAFDWAPDGEHILSYAPIAGEPAAEGEAAILLLRLNVTETRSGETRRLGTIRPTEEFFALLPYFDQYAQSATAWSPDSRNIVFTALTPDGTPGVFVVAASGTIEPRPIGVGVYAVWSWE